MFAQYPAMYLPPAFLHLTDAIKAPVSGIPNGQTISSHEPEAEAIPPFPDPVKLTSDVAGAFLSDAALGVSGAKELEFPSHILQQQCGLPEELRVDFVAG